MLIRKPGQQRVSASVQGRWTSVPLFADDSPLIWKVASVLRWEAEQTWEKKERPRTDAPSKSMFIRETKDLFYLHSHWIYYIVVAASIVPLTQELYKKYEITDGIFLFSFFSQTIFFGQQCWPQRRVKAWSERMNVCMHATASRFALIRLMDVWGIIYLTSAQLIISSRSTSSAPDFDDFTFDLLMILHLQSTKDAATLRPEAPLPAHRAAPRCLCQIRTRV